MRKERIIMVFCLTIVTLLFASGVKAGPPAPIVGNDPEPFDGVPVEEYEANYVAPEISYEMLDTANYIPVEFAPSSWQYIAEYDRYIASTLSHYNVRTLDDCAWFCHEVGYELKGDYYGTTSIYPEENYNFVIDNHYYEWNGSYHDVYTIFIKVELFKTAKIAPNEVNSNSQLYVEMNFAQNDGGTFIPTNIGGSSSAAAYYLEQAGLPNPGY